MKEEVLRLDRVTCLDQGVMTLNHLSLSVYAGEIMGLIPVNGTGLHTLIRLLRQNLPLHYGYVYYRERLVNQWQRPGGGYNRISVIESRSGLADELTVSDNVFVLRHGFGKHVIQRGVLGRQLAPFLRDIGVEISADAYAHDLTVFERLVVEIVKAVVAGCRLVLLSDVGAVVSDRELHRLHDILRHYAGQGISFLYVSQHYEEIRQVCERAALMMNGQIAKVLNTAETGPEAIRCFGVEHYEEMVRAQRRHRVGPREPQPAFEIRNLWQGSIAGLSLRVAPGECVVLQDLDNRIMDDLLDILVRRAPVKSGYLRIAGEIPSRANRREVAVIQMLAHQTMLFPDLSYMENLCFTMDHRMPRVWLCARSRKSIRTEYAAWLGEAVFDQPIGELTQMQKYDLIYARVLLQRPKIVFCVQPFMQADVEQRMHIWRLLDRLLEKRIAVVILAVNLADTLSLADRLIQLQGGRVAQEYDREAFGLLPENTPWRYLWKQSVREV